MLSLLASALIMSQSPDSQTSEAPSITAMTYNIRFATAPDGDDAWPNRREALIEIIRKHDPDMFGVQEALASQVDELRQAFRTHAVVGVGRDDGLRKGEYSAVFYRRSRFGLREGGTRWISPTPEIPGSLGGTAKLPRIFSWGEFFLAEGGRILVMNAHLDHQSPEARLLGATQMADFARTRPSVPSLIMGDFNSYPEDEPISHLRNAGWQVSRPPAGPFVTFNGWKPDITEGDMIDFVLASPEWEMIETTIDRSLTPAGRAPSDHFPVITKLRLKPSN